MDTFEQSNLTRAQLVFWLGQKLNPDLPLYHMAVGLFIPKAIDHDAFFRAFQELINRCDALRTVIEMKDGVPQQRALEHLQYDPEFLDFSAEPDPDTAYRAWADERTQRLFNFEQRLFDCVLAKLADDHYVWYFSQHHIICDMFSFVIAVHYMSKLYDAALEGALDEVERLPQFADYIQHELSHRGALGDPAQRAYWENKLSREPDPISFYGRPVPRVPGPTHRENVDMGDKLSRQIRELAENSLASAKTMPAAQFNIFAAILFAYLKRICGVNRPSIGMPFHNRRHESWKRTVGIFMGVLPLTVEVDDSDTLNTLIAKTGAEAAANLRNSGYFFHNLLHTQAHDILVNGLFIAFPIFGGVTCNLHWPVHRTVLDPLVFNFYENPETGNFANLFFFNTAIFTDEMRTLLVRDFDRMAHALLDNPDTPIGDVDILTDDERRQLLVDWNRTELPFPSDKTLHQLVEAQVERTPDAVAVAFVDKRLTYRELNDRANHLAQHLKSLGVGPDVLVGVCIERSLDMVVALLGILKAGGAYLPLDPSYPMDRLAFMLADSNAQVVISTEKLSRSLPVNGARLICIDRDWDAIASSGPAENPRNGVTAGDLAYVIYTSGSTGKPKGSMLEHRGACNLITHKSREFGLGPGKRVLQFCSLSFDPSVCEIFATLASGGTLWLVPQETVTAPDELVRVIKKERIDTALMTPSLLRMLPAEELPELTVVESGGEPCPATLAARWAKGRKFFNAYGPTETTVCATTAECEPRHDEPPPIGRPIPNTRVYVLDEKMRMVPPGTPGELYIGGVGVGRGYLNRPDLTAERFVPNPFSSDPEDRLYKTGDRVRFRLDGNIEFLGRMDHQVKIRGHRIELGEVETVLQQFPDVSECVVAAREDTPGDMRLVAYIVPRRTGQTFDGELKGYLRQLLPEYMMPSAFVVLDRLPLTPNGKIDRAALPKPERPRTDHHEIAAPRDAIELELQQIWEQVLGVGPIGVTDHFFDVGGHSLSAVHLMDQIHKHFGARLAPAALFEAPTIEAQAGLIRRSSELGPAPIVVPLKPTGTKSPFFCVHPAPGTVFCYMPLLPAVDPDRPFYGLQAPTVDGVGTVFDSIPEAARVYVKAIKEVQPQGPYYLGGHSSGGTIAFEMAQQLLAQGDTVGAVVMLDTMAPVPGGRSEDLYRVIVDVTNDTIWLASIVLLVEHFFATDLNVTYKMLRTMPPDQQVQTVLDALKRIKFLSPSADAGAIRGMLDNFKRTLQATMQYQSKVLDAPLVFLKTADLFTTLPEGILVDGLTNFGKAMLRNWRMTIRVLPQIARDIATAIGRSGRFRRILSEDTLGWRRFTSKPVLVRSIPGNHITMLTGPHAAELGRQLSASLDLFDGNK